MSKGVERCRKVLKGVERCRKVSKGVERCRKVLKGVENLLCFTLLIIIRYQTILQVNTRVSEGMDHPRRVFGLVKCRQ